MALVRGDRPVIGAVYNPMLDEFYTAAEGQGATLNGHAIHVSPRDTLEGCRMLGDRAMLLHPAWNKASRRSQKRIETIASKSVCVMGYISAISLLELHLNFVKFVRRR